jgi:hypothetical protein
MGLLFPARQDRFCGYLPGILWPIRLGLYAVLSLLPAPAGAWNSGSHRLVVALAWPQMTPTAKAQVNQILRAHPDYPALAAQAREPMGEAGAGVFAEASTWPDTIRDDPRFYDADRGAPTRPLDGLADTERHRDWHYLNRPLPPTKATAALPGALDQAIGATSAILADASRPAAERAVALAWFAHLLADAHQPLHVATRIGADGHSDRGGNTVWIIDPSRDSAEPIRLHAFWDGLPAAPWLRGAALKAVAADWPVADGDALDSSPNQWIEESYVLALEFAYPERPATDGEGPIRIDERFRRQAKAAAFRQTALAGTRLALRLNALLP